MAISFGPKLGLINNANINEVYYDPFRPFLQAIDALLFANVINATTVVPPASPNDGDAYLLVGTPSGVWTGHQFSIAVWDVQVTNSGTNTRNPQWVFYAPNPGWFVYNVATAVYLGWNGTAWTTSPFGGGADFPVNTDITSMVGIPNTTLDGTGYQLGTPASSNGIVITQNQVSGGIIDGTHAGFQLGFDLGAGVGATLLLSDGSGHGTTISATNGITMNGGMVCGTILTTGNINLTSGGVVSSDRVQNFSPGTTLVINTQSITGRDGLIFDSGGSVSLQNLFGFKNYPTQTTVGSAGAASALPATPDLYVQYSINGTVYVSPLYKQV